MIRFPQQPFPVRGGIDEPGCMQQHQGVRVGVKGDGTGGTAMLRRQRAAGRQQRLVTHMDPVKKTQGVDYIVHNSYLQLNAEFRMQKAK